MSRPAAPPGRMRVGGLSSGPEAPSEQWQEERDGGFREEGALDQVRGPSALAPAASCLPGGGGTCRRSRSSLGEGVPGLPPRRSRVWGRWGRAGAWVPTPAPGQSLPVPRQP